MAAWRSLAVTSTARGRGEGWLGKPVIRFPFRSGPYSPRGLRHRNGMRDIGTHTCAILQVGDKYGTEGGGAACLLRVVRSTCRILSDGASSVKICAAQTRC